MEKILFVTGNKTYSSWSMRGWLALKQTGAVFEEIVVPLFVAGYKQELLKYSPAGKVPILKYGGRSVWDSLAICEYLAELFPDARLWPEDVTARAEARAVSAEMHSGFPVIRREYPFNCRASGRRVSMAPALQAEVQRVQTIWSACRERHGQLGPWLFGHFTIADCMYIPVALRFVTYGTELAEVSAGYLRTVQQYPAVRAWVAAAKLEKEIIESEEVGRTK